MKTMILWSGGLDSTWLLHQQKQPVDVLSVELKHYAELSDRSKLELQARNNIKRFYPQHNYFNSKLQIETTFGIRDIINTVFIAGQYAMLMKYNQNDQILLGANCNDDYRDGKNSISQDVHLKMNYALRCSYGNNSIPKVTFSINPPSRLQQLKDLGKIADLTWSCRNPINDEQICNKCVPCININEAKNSLKGIIK